MPITTCVFDAYGTLFDVAAAAREAAAEPGNETFAEHWVELAKTWRLKQLQYTWLRAAAGVHQDFWSVTQDGLDYALDERALDDPTLRQRLLELYWRLAAYPEVPDMLRGDAGRLQQILSNLVDNAIRNTLRGRVDATIELASTPTPDSVHLLFAVRDTGVGIPLELRTSIFEAFVQGPAADGQPASGIGLGLAIARELTALLGGRIWLESEVGAGSVFYFTTAFGCVDPAV